MSEDPDVTSPGVSSVTVNLNNNVRQVIFQLNETADVTPTSLVNPANFKLINTGGVGELNLDGSVVLDTGDGTTITLQMTEAQRVTALEFSGTPGGDLQALDVVISANSIVDIAQFTVAESVLTVIEIADTTLPTLLRGSIDYNDGSLTLFF
jgi:hypothetical protein